MLIDNVLSSNTQLAGLIAACVTKSAEYQLIRDSPCEWGTMAPMLEPLRGAFTHERKVKVHPYLKPSTDLNHSAIWNRTRRFYPTLEDNSSIYPSTQWSSEGFMRPPRKETDD